MLNPSMLTNHVSVGEGEVRMQIVNRQRRGLDLNLLMLTNPVTIKGEEEVGILKF